MNNWKTRYAWLREFGEPAPAGTDCPFHTAEAEAEIYNRNRKEDAPRLKPVLDETLPEEAYILKSGGSEIQIKGGSKGVLYGTYAAAGSVTEKVPVPEGLNAPYWSLRMLDSWDNMDGSVERGYAGRSIWFEADRYSYDPARIRQLGRMLASVGINVLCINNVNVHVPAQDLLDGMLDETAAFADLLRPFGVRLMVSVDFSLPLQRGLVTADPLDENVCLWWGNFAERAWKAIPDLAGYLIKADSEHRPGPNTYGRTHPEGANMLARSVAPYGGVVVWRAFVYNCTQDWRDASTDRPCAAYDLYHPLDGQFDENVILQVKYGPFDFQVREPASPLFYGMKNTHLGCELQLAQEYTGQQIDLFAMPALWREIFDSVGTERIHAVAAVSNLGRDACWTGHPFAALNLYAYGRSAWNPDAEPEEIVRSWVRQTYDLPSEQEDALTDMLMKSRSAYERYTATLGLDWMMRPETHYGPSPYGYEFDVWGTYTRADRDAVGTDRTKTGTGLTEQYPEEQKALYSDSSSCPDELLLFFHRLPYNWRMRDGRTLIQRIYDDHFEGCDEAQKMQKILAGLSLPEPDAQEAAERMNLQLLNAREWRDVINTFFYRLSGIPDEHGRKIWP